MLFISKIVLAYIYIPNFSPEIGTFQSILLHAKTGILASLQCVYHNVTWPLGHLQLFCMYNRGELLISLYIYSWKNKNSKIC